MANSTVEQMRAQMDKRYNIRNIGIANNDALADILVQRACAAQAKATDEPTTVRSTAVSLLYEMTDADQKMVQQKTDGNGYNINLVDMPSHVGNTATVETAMHLIDGLVLTSDIVSGMNVTSKTALRLAIANRVKPIMFFDNMGEALTELQLEMEDLYQTFCHNLETANTVVATYTDDASPMGKIQLDPSKGSIFFGDSAGGWAFSLRQFAVMYAAKFKIPVTKLMGYLWGDNFYDAKKRKWTKDQALGTRGFSAFVLAPIYNMADAVMNNKEHVYTKLIEKLDLKLTAEDKELSGQPLFKKIMQSWLPAADPLLKSIVINLPSPVVAQKYRAEILYQGPKDDKAYKGIANCDPKGPLMLYVSKMIPTTDKGRFFAYGRVFSGTVGKGMKVRIMGPNFVLGKTEDLYSQAVQQTVLMMGPHAEPVEDVPVGNVCGLAGVDQFLVRTGTLSTYEKAHKMKQLTFDLSAIVKVAVEPKDAQHLPKLVEGLKRLAKAEPSVMTLNEESGEHVVACSDELEMARVLKDLEELYACIPLKKSDSITTYKETVTEKSNQTCLSKSPNKHNRLFMTAQQMPEGLPEDIDCGKIASHQDFKKRARYIGDKYDWDLGEARKIWCFGPEGTGPNVMVDVSKGVQYLNEIKDSVVAGFQWATKQGVLCDEQMRGVRFNLHDVTLHDDANYRGGGQIIPTTKRVLHASVLTATPRIMEPVYLVEISCPQDSTGGIYSCLNKRRGHIFKETKQEGTPMVTTQAYLPVNESFGFTADLKTQTGGKAAPICVFDHWQVMADDPMDATSKSGVVVSETRKRKGLSENIPSLDSFLDKL